ncbi:MAG: hypothetical protein EXX96DRAFT_582350 [Benjaminiella poitrasii]|nr:MAG: hypothetical protein EXX96DRAFT_582350 [Benjaminiella poitrasii]
MKAGLQAFLIDEYCTSKVCPVCNMVSLQYTGRRHANPRPYRRRQHPEVSVHGN